MRIFGRDKSNAPTVAGDISCLGLTDWWNHLAESERTAIRRAFKPMGASANFAIDRGATMCEGQRAAKLLYTVAGWVKENPELQLKILTESERRATYVLDQHFLYHSMIEYWYRLRDQQAGARETAIQYCQKQIAISKSAASEWRKGDRDMNAMHKRVGVKPPNFDGRMPTHTGFKQLAIIREKEGDYADGIRLCHQAKKDGWAGDWNQRIERLEAKSK